MSCDLSFDEASDDADPVEFVDSKIVVARKDHVCVECKGQIRKDETHRRVAYRFEGQFHAERICQPCMWIAAEFEHHVLGGYLWDQMAEAWDEGAHVLSCIARCPTVASKAKMRDRFNAYQEQRLVVRRQTRARRQANARRDSATE